MTVIEICPRSTKPACSGHPRLFSQSKRSRRLPYSRTSKPNTAATPARSSNIVTKSGTNNLHGSLFEFFRNNWLDARNFFNPKPDPQTAFRNNQFGVALGGPIVKNKTFWFMSYEGQRERVGLNSVARVPDPREIAALGGATNSVIAKLLTRNPWPAPNRPVPLFDPTPNLFVTTPRATMSTALSGRSIIRLTSETR